MGRRALSRIVIVAAAPALFAAFGCGGGGGGGGNTGGGAGAGTPPGQVAGLTATVSVNQVALAWTAIAGATSYAVARASAGGAAFTQIASISANSYTDTAVTPGTTYTYEVSAANAAGSGPASAPVTALALGNQAVSIDVDALADRHPISPLIYGVDFPPSAAYIQQTGASFVRWGGNASSRYNWKNFYANSANDWYFQDNGFQALGLGNSTADTGADSVLFAQTVAAAGADPLMTLPMLGWVAKGGPSYYSFSVQKYGPQCKTNPYLADDGDGLAPDCQTPITGNDPNDANVPLLDAPGANDPAGAVYRSQWVAALAPAFGAAPHFYDLGNEPDIWAGTHRDVHPAKATYAELRDDFVLEAGNLKTWDPQAIAFGPVSCCWWYYWNSDAGAADKDAHGGLDFWPWWLNEVEWEGEIQGRRLLDVFDLHAYPELNTPKAGTSAAAIDGEILAATRGWWDPTWSDTQSWIGTSSGVTSQQPNPTAEARLVRALAVAHEIDPELPISVTEWNFGLGLTGADPIAVALADADAWGLLGRYGAYAAARWTAPDPNTEAPSVAVLELFRNYDGKNDGFDPISVAANNDCATAPQQPYDCSTFAAVSAAGTQLTLLIVNKSAYDQLTAGINLANFTATQVAAYSVSAASPAQITAAAPAAFSGSVIVPPYSATLLVFSGQMSQQPVDWSLNPAIVMMPAGGSITLHPALLAGASGSVTLAGIQSDAGISGTIAQPSVTASQPGAITIAAGATPGFYHFTVTAGDSSGATQTKSGIIEAGNPAATLTAAGSGQTAPAGATVTLSVTVNPGQSGVNAAGLDILFTASAGALAAGANNTLVAQAASGAQLLETTDAAGSAVVTLTLPAVSGATVTVTAEGPYGAGHPVATFTETTQ